MNNDLHELLRFLNSYNKGLPEDVWEIVTAINLRNSYRMAGGEVDENQLRETINRKLGITE